MDKKEIKETDVWVLYERAVNFCSMMGMFNDTDLNYRMYNGDQWQGLKIKGIEKIQYNFIKPIVKYKTGIILSNLYAINFSSENFEFTNDINTADSICRMLNKKAARIWEKDYMDVKLRYAVKDAAINDEGIIYVNVDNGEITNEIINKNDIYYANENDPDIQKQPYILIKQRKPVSEVQEIARRNGVPEWQIAHIMGDNDNIEEAGESAKYEKENMVTLVTKMYKENGSIYFSQATKYVELKKDKNTTLSYYPVAHLLWEEKKGSARGEGEVRFLIPNQLETNKTAMRRALTVKNTAYPQKVVNESKIMNPNSLNQVGGVIKVKGGNVVDDVSKIIANLNPAQMSGDVEKLQIELIQTTRELAGAGDIATGQVNPESASGRAILAVQQASQQPLTEHLLYTKVFIEDLARIWLDIIIAYNDLVNLEQEEINQQTGETERRIVRVKTSVLKELQASVKVDITPKGAFDKYAQEQSIENMFTAGKFDPNLLPQLETYVDLLDDDSVMPKQKLVKAVKNIKEQQEKIARIDAEAQLMKQKANQFLMGDIDLQASQIAEARSGIAAEAMPEEVPAEEMQEEEAMF